ncbi:hypothetical protein [Phenylobacterium sp.]|uniref:hypothetical protein n=1 Tax=Phenylobacterium sp. TaxID=1871053 RepID=UPI0025F44D7E|nr:hypothetical protein [Phenylobacterium sp.]MBX3484776.1 hypothetical protein [Phenylobacterium sp.]MCW5758616.1 hypothetical protein [Phenylobacterium sp.]
MNTELIDRIMNSAVLAKILEQYDFEPAVTISIQSHRDDANWAERASVMRDWCQVNTKARWRFAAPMEGTAMDFHFESEADAALFKLYFY